MSEDGWRRRTFGVEAALNYGWMTTDDLAVLLPQMSSVTLIRTVSHVALPARWHLRGCFEGLFSCDGRVFNLSGGNASTRHVCWPRALVII